MAAAYCRAVLCHEQRIADRFGWRALEGGTSFAKTISSGPVRLKPPPPPPFVPAAPDRLDVHNGLLIVGAMGGFDRGLVSFADDGRPPLARIQASRPSGHWSDRSVFFRRYARTTSGVSGRPDEIPGNSNVVVRRGVGGGARSQHWY
jgi:hypothetical protein